MKKRYIFLILGLIIVGYFPVKYVITGRTTPNEYEENYVYLASHVKSPLICEKINKNVYSSNFFDAGGFTYYLKSQCYYELAKTMVDDSYCDKVVERKSIFLDGNWFSSLGCEETVGGHKRSGLKYTLPSSSTHTENIILMAMGYSAEEIIKETQNDPAGRDIPYYAFMLNHSGEQDFLSRLSRLPDFSQR